MEWRILFVDDDTKIGEAVWTLLEEEGYQVDEAVDGMSAASMADDTYGLIILDMMVPGCPGFSTCVKIRKRSAVPILFLTARARDSNKIMGFGVGGDDCLVKSLPHTELAARVKAMIRRCHAYKGKMEEEGGGVIMVKDLTIQKAWNKVRRAGEEFLLVDLEYRILFLLVCNRGRISTIGGIYESIQGEPFFYSANNTVMVHTRNLGERLETDPKNSKYTVSVWGKGYWVE